MKSFQVQQYNSHAYLVSHAAVPVSIHSYMGGMPFTDLIGQMNKLSAQQQDIYVVCSI
jgi:hypothetical protein